ncbi:MAG: hypothetical protein Q9187_004713, partial [Circinaria calcarea]
YMTPPLDEEEENEESRLLEAQGRKELENDGCPPCYPPDLEIPLQNPPEKYQPIIGYWQSFPGTGDVVLRAELSEWRKRRPEASMVLGKVRISKVKLKKRNGQTRSKEETPLRQFCPQRCPSAKSMSGTQTRGAGITKHQPQTANRKSARLEAIQHLEGRTDSKGQNTKRHPFSSPLTSNTRSSNLPAYKKPTCPDQRIISKRKRSQGTEDPIPQIEDQPINPERKTFTRENEEHHQLPSPSTSNSHEQPTRKKRRRAVSIIPRSEEINNCYPKRRDSPIFETPEQEPEAQESEEKKKDNPIGYWAANHTWPDNFAESCAMSSDNINKRPRTSDHSQSSKDEKSRSYSQSRKDGDVPEQYTKTYEKWIFTQGLDMSYIKGREYISPDSKLACQELRKIEYSVISPTIYPEDKIIHVVDLCQNTNEATVNRDITTLILPPIKALHLTDEANRFKHFTDQVKSQWHESWVLAGPRPEPDLAVGFLHSAFTVSENEKLTNYTSFENLTRSTNEMCFPFLMCEVKCGDKGLDYADRQNMHSCSVAVKALLKLEQKADQYREDKLFESLLGKILVYSISHDQNDARVWGHFALVEGGKWTYYRYHIGKFDIAHDERALLALHNFARKVLTVYAPKLLERLQKAVAALPVSSTLSFSAGTMNLEDDSQQSSQQPSQGRDADLFAAPVLPASAQKLFDEQKEQMERQKEQIERQREEMDKLLQQMEQQRKENKEKEEKQREQMEQLMKMLEQRLA